MHTLYRDKKMNTIKTLKKQTRYIQFCLNIGCYCIMLGLVPAIRFISLEPNTTALPTQYPENTTLCHWQFSGQNSQRNISALVLTCGTGQTVGWCSLAERDGSHSGGRRSWRQLLGWQICLKNLIWKLCLRDLRFLMSQNVTLLLLGNSNGCKIMWRAHLCRASSRSLCPAVTLWCHTMQLYLTTAHMTHL